ncbi:ankyrin repeat-containing protein [Grosmannia clavigera kw1407]|uniref:Ankyrin repeat-containing protein n=1 Tax=Grosmannia clavigera (strain kw1407 / UAMH 11150) TaxID=655863 RepID=F0X6K1_GROCL|nr:ankyrin repeat-containing protein [Grosmannia clavigera kw1407]EFX06551.1 ankyrin repeat-containing protein [Grosmannia clavigera kw1407]
MDELPEDDHGHGHDHDADEPRWTALQLAAGDGDLARVRALLDGGHEQVNAPATGYNGRTALQAACLGGHRDVVRVLLEAGADVDAPGGNNSMRTALQLACGVGGEEEEDEDEDEKDKKHDDVNTDNTDNDPIHLLLAAGAALNAPAARYNGRTALQAAAETGPIATVALLLRLGADVNAAPATNAGLTALQAACLAGRRAVVSRLLDAGADVNAPACRYKGYTALQAACVGDGDDVCAIVDLLLAAGADPNAPGSGYRGGTALHAAAHVGHVDVVRRLLAAGARVNAAAGPARQSPLQTALLGEHAACADVLRAAGGIAIASRATFLFEF